MRNPTRNRVPGGGSPSLDFALTQSLVPQAVRPAVSAPRQPQRGGTAAGPRSFFPPVAAGLCRPFQALEDSMAYDRYDTRNAPRDERARWSGDRSRGQGRSSDDDRGFFDRASDEVASWFGDDEAERRREQDRRMDERERGYGGERREFG